MQKASGSCSPKSFSGIQWEQLAVENKTKPTGHDGCSLVSQPNVYIYNNNTSRRLWGPPSFFCQTTRRTTSSSYFQHVKLANICKNMPLLVPTCWTLQTQLRLWRRVHVDLQSTRLRSSRPQHAAVEFRRAQKGLHVPARSGGDRADLGAVRLPGKCGWVIAGFRTDTTNTYSYNR
jgi:hypothetical protein